MKPIRIPQPPIPLTNQLTKPKSVTKESGFANLLKDAQQTLTVSKHATQRIAQRQIHITDFEWQQIQDKLSTAQEKGLNDSLFLTKNAALIINVKSNTVVTALDRQEASEQIFTNIDGAIIL